ncbi:type II secretion system F family protein [Novosphingobium sp. AP12]|uniref:type II secretion system F family protein n=1 Tax=Novosphingobium sp. AP12 TaxID=1144305 RepID=UPI00027224AD|nr:type II secretion system F family protein [Novosphingobium sp. AP12]EJL20477.1 Flp pilus assembly protein TadC [Novosphingobium sp. AP12]
MGGVLAFLSFAVAIGGVVLIVAGIRWLHVDSRLRVRIEGQAMRSLGQPARGWQGLRPPRIPLGKGRDRDEIEKRLRTAGYFEPGAVDVFVFLRIAASLVVAVACMATCWAVTGNPFKPIFPTFALTGLTYIGAKYALQMRASARERLLTAEFPFLLDLMLMMLESGVSLDQCFRGIARDERVAVPNHARLVAMLVEDLDRGQDYQVAFERWAARVNVNGSRELAALFRQSLFQGMELVPALREFIREFSQRRVASAREAIGKITVRMVVLMLVFFMPALFIVLAGPPVAAIFDTLRSNSR